MTLIRDVGEVSISADICMWYLLIGQYDDAELQSYARNNKYDAFNRLKTLIYNPDLDLNGHAPSPSSTRLIPNNPMQPQNQYQNNFASNPTRPAPVMPPITKGLGPSEATATNGPGTY